MKDVYKKDAGLRRLRQLRLEATKEYRAKRAQEQREIYKFRKERGLCVACGKEDAVISITLCQSCREKHNAKQIKKTKEEKAKYVILNRRWRNRKYKLGLCIICGKKNHLPGLKLCSDCRIKINQARYGYVEHTHKWYEKERRLGRL